MLDSLEDCYRCILPSFVKKHPNDKAYNDIIYYNFPFLLRSVFETYQVYYTVLLIYCF